MTWGSASADRSIIASTPLPRTPVTPARKGRDSRPPGAGQPALIYKHRALGPWHRADGALRSTARSVPPGTSPNLFGGRVGSTEVRQTALFGAPRAAPHRRTTTSTPRGAGSHPPSGKGTWSSSEPRAPHLTGTRRVELFGAARARFRPGQGNRTSSEGRHPRLDLARVSRPRGRAPRPPGAAV
jgi:hypothetical protein